MQKLSGKIFLLVNIMAMISTVAKSDVLEKFVPIYKKISTDTWSCKHTKIPFVFSYKSTLKISNPQSSVFQFDITFDGVMPDIGSKASVLPKHFTGTGRYTMDLVSKNGSGEEKWLWTKNASEGGHKMLINEVVILEDEKKDLSLLLAKGPGHMLDDETEEDSDYAFHVLYDAKEDSFTWGYAVDEFSICERMPSK